MTTSEILFKAAQIIERDGLYKGGWFCLGKRCCTIGAIRKAATGNAEQYWCDIKKVRPIIRQLIGTESIPEWNDAPDRTAEEVIDMLVIASVEAQS